MGAVLCVGGGSEGGGCRERGREEGRKGVLSTGRTN